MYAICVHLPLERAIDKPINLVKPSIFHHNSTIIPPQLHHSSTTFSPFKALDPLSPARLCRLACPRTLPLYGEGVDSSKDETINPPPKGGGRRRGPPRGRTLCLPPWAKMSAFADREGLGRVGVEWVFRFFYQLIEERNNGKKRLTQRVDWFFYQLIEASFISRTT